MTSIFLALSALISIFSLTFVPTMLAGNTKSDDNISGHYILSYDDTHQDDSIYFDIQQTTNDQIKFSASSYWVGANPENVHTGEIEGTIPVKDGKAVYNDNFSTPVSYTDNSPEAVYDPAQPDKFQGCHVEMTFAKNSIHVEDNYRCGGMNVTFTGDFRRK